MTNFSFHRPAEAGFVANGSEAEAKAYQAALNHGRCLNLWTATAIPGSRPRGIKLSKLLADHAKARAGANAATRHTLHGTKQ
jgi:hypothetical protein